MTKHEVFISISKLIIITLIHRLISTTGRLSKESQQDYDLYVQQRLMQQQQQQNVPTSNKLL